MAHIYKAPSGLLRIDPDGLMRGDNCCCEDCGSNACADSVALASEITIEVDCTFGYCDPMAGSYTASESGSTSAGCCAWTKTGTYLIGGQPRGYVVSFYLDKTSGSYYAVGHSSIDVIGVGMGSTYINVGAAQNCESFDITTTTPTTGTNQTNCQTSSKQIGTDEWPIYRGYT